MLRQRILSSLVLGPVALAAAWVGGWAFAALAALAAALLAWEWARLCLGGFGPAGAVLAAMGIAAALLAMRAPLAAFAAIALAMPLAPLLDKSAGRALAWTVLGCAYIGVPVVAAVWLSGLGRQSLLWLLLTVWATDIGAYAAGRLIGGPRLAPRISPNKTWAGLAGGAALAAGVGWAASALAHLPAELIWISPLLALVAQAGDLAESALKRHFGVKDTSRLIPGHGGLLDRLDGMLAAAPVAAAVCLVGGGDIGQWR